MYIKNVQQFKRWGLIVCPGSEDLSWSGGALMTRCCPPLTYHSSAIVDLYSNLHSFLIKWWSVDREKLASEEVTSGADGISWLEGNLLHNVLIHIWVPLFYTANFSLPVLFPQVALQSCPYLFSHCLTGLILQAPLFLIFPHASLSLYLPLFPGFVVLLASLSWIDHVFVMKGTAFISTGMRSS